MPLLTLGFGLPLREAVGVSLVCVIVTSCAAAGVYLERHVANLRLGMRLELFTATGALVGGLVAFLLSERVLAGLFAVLLVYTAFTMARRRDAPSRPAPRPTAADRARRPRRGRRRRAPIGRRRRVVRARRTRSGTWGRAIVGSLFAGRRLGAARRRRRDRQGAR